MTYLLAIEAPKGAVLEFALLFAIVLLGPVLVEKAKVPGIIGLLLGGYIIGSHGVGLIGSGNQTIPELGQLGLLYLMFVAGLELDLNLLKEYKKAAITFGVMTFLFPFVAGVAVGLQQGWTVPASLLLGSLLASHTLILYPTIRDAGRGANPAVASAVGATVLTDTLALVVLAGVAGTSTGEGSTASVLAEVAVGLVVLVVVALLVLPKVALAALKLWGGDRAARYLVSIISFLAMAMLAEVFGIEGIVGAFFAGLALNRLVPNDGPSMDRIEFFGSAIFIPIFLVSVGLLLDPSVMFTKSTLGIAALLCVACLGGKAIAAALTRPLLKFSGAEAGVMFVLTTPQAAATLAATLVGFDIGLFSTSVVNAVLVLILVSILVSTLLADRYAARIPMPTPPEGTLGERVLVAAGATGPSPAALRVADALAGADSGVVDVVIVHTEGEPALDARAIRSLERTVFRGSIDGSIRTVVDRTLADGVAHSALTHPPTALIIDASAVVFDEDLTPLARHLAGIPSLLVRGEDVPRGGSVKLVTEATGEDGSAAARVAAILASGRNGHVERTPADGFDGGTPGSVVVIAAQGWSEADQGLIEAGAVQITVIEA